MSNHNTISKLILLTRGTKGDLYPFIHIGRGFKERGHDVVLLSNYCYKTFADKEGFDFQSIAMEEEESFKALIDMTESYCKLPALLKVWQEQIVPNLVEEFEIIAAKVEYGKTAIFAHSNYYFSALFAVEKFHLPLYLCILSPSFIHSFSLFEGIANKLSKELNDARGQIGLAPVKDWRIWLNSYTRCFAFWPEWFSAEQKKIVPALEYIGFLSVDGMGPKPLQGDLINFVQGNTRTILITHGTSQPFNKQYFQIAIKVCQRLNCKIVVSTPFRHLLPHILMENVMWVEYAPFEQLLPSIDLIVHHGGIGTTRESVAKRVPQLIIGQGFDRQDNGRIVKSLQLGDYILPKVLSEELLYEKLSYLLSDAQTKSAIDQYAILLEHQKPYDDFYKSIACTNGQQNIDQEAYETSKTEDINTRTDLSKDKTNKAESMKLLSQSKQQLLLQMLKNKERCEQQKQIFVSDIEKKSGIGLSAAQNRIWKLAQLDPENPVYRVMKGYELQGSIDSMLLERAFTRLIQQQEILRTHFIQRGEDVVQILNDNVSFKLERYHAVALEQKSEQKEFLAKLLSDDSKQPFELSQAPLLRAKLITFAGDKNVLILVGHLLICEAYALDLIFRGLGAYYCDNNSSTKLTMQHADYVVSQARLFKDGTIDKQKTYWQQQLAGMNTVLEFPLDKHRTEKPNHNGDYITFSLGRSLTESIKNAAKFASASPFMFLLTAYNILYFRFTGRTDIVLGNPISYRKNDQWRSIVGHFANMLILRNRFAEQMSTKDVLAVVRKNTLDSFANQDIPFEMLLNMVDNTGYNNRNPVVQNVFSFNNVSPDLEDWDNLSVANYSLDTGISKYDLEMSLWEQYDGFNVYLIYNKHLFHKATIERIKEAFHCILITMVNNIDCPILDVPLLKECVLDATCTSPFSEQVDHHLYQAFSQQVARQSDAVALVDDNGQLSYGELNAKVNMLSSGLAKAANQPIGLCFEHSIDAVIVILALVKIGQSFVFISPDCLKEEREAIIDASGLTQIITQPWLLDFLEWPDSIKCFCFSDSDGVYPEQSLCEHQDKVINEMVVNDSTASYYRRDSSSKAFSEVRVSVSYINQSLGQMITLTEVSVGDRLILSMPFEKPQALTELALMLSAGGCIVVEDLTCHKSSAYWKALLSNSAISHLFLTYEQMESLQQTLNDESCKLPELLRHVIVTNGPDQVHLINPNVWSNKRVTQLLCLDDSAHYDFYVDLKQNDTHCSWRSMGTRRFMVANKALQPCPPNVSDVLYCFNDVTWEATKLYARQIMENQWQLFKSREMINDVAVYPSKIANTLRAHPSVRYALVRLDQGGLHAYIVPEAKADDKTPAILNKYLKVHLPSYELPKSIQFIDQIPIIANGAEVDWGKLPVPSQEAKHIIEPSSEQEKILLDIWSSVLGIPANKISIDDNFFELGGHSLLATQVASRVKKHFKTVLPLKVLFENPTIQALSLGLLPHVSAKKNRLVI